MGTREELIQLVASLPEGAIDAAHQSLTRLQVWPPLPPPGRDQALERFNRTQQQVHEKMMARLKPGQAWVGGGTFSSAPAKKRGRQSFGYHDGGGEVHETNIFYDGLEFTVIERIRRDEAAGTVLFAIEVTGPDATTARHEHRYSLP